MTLLAFATYGNRVEFITDQLSYTANVERVGFTTKHTTINHLDAAVMTSGDSLFGHHVHSLVGQLAAQAADFDDLVDSVPEQLHHLWADLVERKSHQNLPMAFATVVIMGWSESRGRFVGFVMVNEHQFEPRLVEGLWVSPRPFSMRPDGLDIERLRSFDLEYARMDEAAANWETRPAGQPPASLEEWMILAETTHEERSLQTFARVLVGGQIVHTKLKRGLVISKAIGAIRDDEETLLEMIKWTAHPLAQKSACYCGSGVRFVDCHAHYREETCGCGSGEQFLNCHYVDAPVSPPVAVEVYRSS